MTKRSLGYNKAQKERASLGREAVRKDSTPISGGNYGEEIGSNKDLRKGFRIYIFVFMAGYCLFNEDVTKLLMIVYHQFLDSIEVVIFDGSSYKIKVARLTHSNHRKI